jgi:hypothetical protein
MPSRSDGGTSKLVWWGMGILATLVTTMAIVLMTGALTKIADHSDRITKLEVKLDALENRVTEVKSNVDRKLNPRPWESRQPKGGNP